MLKAIWTENEVVPYDKRKTISGRRKQVIATRSPTEIVLVAGVEMGVIYGGPKYTLSSLYPISSSCGEEEKRGAKKRKPGPGKRKQGAEKREKKRGCREEKKKCTEKGKCTLGPP